jgi:hypothetical protein
MIENSRERLFGSIMNCTDKSSESLSRNMCGKIPLASGKNLLASGKLPTTSGKNPLASGKLPTASGKNPLASGKFPTVSGKLAMTTGNPFILLSICTIRYRAVFFSGCFECNSNCRAGIGEFPFFVLILSL